MKCLLFALVSILFLPLCVSAGEFKVVKVYDGDTIKVEGHDIQVIVRLIAIDAPETGKRGGGKGQPFSKEAKDYLAGIVLKKVVDVYGYGLDPYGRVLAEICVDGKNVNIEILKAGLAEVYRGNYPVGLNLEKYRKAEIEAKNILQGMWVLGDKYISPREWR